MHELLEIDKIRQEQVTSLVQCFLKLWKQNDCEQDLQVVEKITDGNKINTQENNKPTVHMSGSTTCSTPIGEAKHHTYETAICTNIESVEISTGSTKRNEVYTSHNYSFNSIDHLYFHSVTANNVSNKSEQFSSTSGNLKCRFDKNLDELSNSTCSTIDKIIPSLSFDLSREISTSTTKMEKPTSKLYEYCLTDDDFELSDISNNFYAIK